MPEQNPAATIWLDGECPACFQPKTLFVTEDDRPLGIVHIHDCLRAGAG